MPVKVLPNNLVRETLDVVLSLLFAHVEGHYWMRHLVLENVIVGHLSLPASINFAEFPVRYHLVASVYGLPIVHFLIVGG